jgi:hypothetical protein
VDIGNRLLQRRENLITQESGEQIEGKEVRFFLIMFIFFKARAFLPILFETSPQNVFLIRNFLILNVLLLDC